MTASSSSARACTSQTSNANTIFSEPNFPATVRADERVFTLRHHMALWFSLGVGLLVMQMGAYLVPALGLRSALLAIVVGSLLGAALLAWVAQIGCRLGINSAGLMQLTYGSRFAHLPIVFNIIQLLGWTAFELVIMREGLSLIVQNSFGIDPARSAGVMTWVLGAILFALTFGSMTQVIRRFISRFALPLVIASLLWLSIQFIFRAMNTEHGLSSLWLQSGSGEMSLFAAIDLVIAMPISWLPLVADYARYGQNGHPYPRHSAFKGTFVGYALANIWCYALGVLIVSTHAGAELLPTILLAQFGLIALGFILFDELDNAYGDMYSGSVSLNHLLPKQGLAFWGKVMVVLSVLAAWLLPMHGLEPFLLMLSSVFIPLFGVIIAHLGQNSSPQLRGKIHLPSVVIWLLGIAVFHLLTNYAPQFGSSIPTLLLTFILGKWFNRSDSTR